MVVNYFGENCFRLQNGNLSLLINPANNRLKGDVVLKTVFAAESETPRGSEISFPGEYEIREITIKGWLVNGDSSAKSLKTAYVVNWEEMRLVFLGHLSKTISDSSLLEEISEADVLFLPVGAGYLEPTEAVKLAKKLEPAVIIPSYSKSVSEFVKILGQKTEAQEKFVFRKKDLAELKGRAVVLQTSG